MGWINPATQQTQGIVIRGSGSPSSNAGTILAGGNLIVNLVDVSNYASYDIAFHAYANSPGAASSPISIGVQLYWFDDLTSNVPVFSEKWVTWCAQAVAQTDFGSYFDALSGTGPMHGRYMSVILTTNDNITSSATLQYFYLFGSPRPTSFSDWRQDVTFDVPKPSLAGLVGLSANYAPFANVLCNTFGTGLATLSKVWVPFNLYAGPVQIYYQFSVAPTYGWIAFVDDSLASDPWSVDPGSFFPLNFNTTPNITNLILPRAPCYLVATLGAGAAQTLSVTVKAQQGA